MNQQKRTSTAMAAILLLFSIATPGAAQDASLLRLEVTNDRLLGATIENSSFIYQPLPPESMNRPLQLHDVITVLVDYQTSVLSEGSGESIKTGSFSAVLSDWLKFDGKSISPAPQPNGDPTVSGSVNSQLRAEAEIEASESLTFSIAAEIVDIRPNQNLVIEGRQSIRINQDNWDVFITGTVPRQSILQDRTVRHTSIANLRIEKTEQGAVRDGYARGWLQKWYGKYKAF